MIVKQDPLTIQIDASEVSAILEDYCRERLDLIGRRLISCDIDGAEIRGSFETFFLKFQ